MSIGSIHIPYDIPTLGERGDIPSHKLPLNALAFSQNVLRDKQGRLVFRPGHKQLATSGPGTRIMGLTYYRTTALADRTVAVTQTGAWRFTGSSWVDISGTALTGGTTDE